LIDDACHGGMERGFQLLDLLPVARHAKLFYPGWVRRITNHPVVGFQKRNSLIRCLQVTSGTPKIMIGADRFNPAMTIHAIGEVGFLSQWDLMPPERPKQKNPDDPARPC
jgi:hypothetical protein